MIQEYARAFTSDRVIGAVLTLTVLPVAGMFAPAEPSATSVIVDTSTTPEAGAVSACAAGWKMAGLTAMSVAGMRAIMLRQAREVNRSLLIFWFLFCV